MIGLPARARRSATDFAMALPGVLSLVDIGTEGVLNAATVAHGAVTFIDGV